MEVAAPVLTHSHQLGDHDLIETAKAKSQLHLLAISRRQALNEVVTDVLVDRGDEQVVRAVSKNAGARFSDAGFGVLLKRSESDDILAAHVGTRGDIPRHHFLKLIAKASHAARAKLAAAHPEAAQDVQQVLADVVGKIRAEAVSVSTQYDAAAKQAVAARIRSGPLTRAEVYHSAKANKFEETAVALALISGVPIEMVETAMLEDRPDMIFILAKTAGLSWSTSRRLCCCGPRIGASPRSIWRMLSRASRQRRETARRVVRFYRTRTQAAV